jgi:hypothetical protein
VAEAASGAGAHTAAATTGPSACRSSGASSSASAASAGPGEAAEGDRANHGFVEALGLVFASAGAVICAMMRATAGRRAR